MMRKPLSGGADKQYIDDCRSASWRRNDSWNNIHEKETIAAEKRPLQKAIDGTPVLTQVSRIVTKSARKQQNTRM